MQKGAKWWKKVGKMDKKGAKRGHPWGRHVPGKKGAKGGKKVHACELQSRFPKNLIQTSNSISSYILFELILDI